MARISYLRTLLVLAVGLSLGPLPCAGQNGGNTEGLARADSLLMEAHLARAAMAEYEAILAQEPDNFEALWRASRACLVLGILEDTWEPRKAWHRKGEEYGRRAEALHPSDINATYWRVANQGRWAKEEPGAWEALRLVKAVRAGADSILRVDPDHAGAQNVMGMFYLEILSLSPMARAIGMILAPSAIRKVHWADAHNHLRRAVALEPDNILYLRDYSQALLWHGDTLEARSYLQRAVQLPEVSPMDATFLAQARALLKEAGG